jgi:hypothetical protein
MSPSNRETRKPGFSRWDRVSVAESEVQLIRDFCRHLGLKKTQQQTPKTPFCSPYRYEKTYQTGWLNLQRFRVTAISLYWGDFTPHWHQ